MLLDQVWKRVWNMIPAIAASASMDMENLTLGLVLGFVIGYAIRSLVSRARRRRFEEDYSFNPRLGSKR